jgi:hypothetical protein
MMWISPDAVWIVHVTGIVRVKTEGSGQDAVPKKPTGNATS